MHSLELVGKSFKLAPETRWVASNTGFEDVTEEKAKAMSPTTRTRTQDIRTQELLKKAVAKGSPDDYLQALHLERYRDALQNNANVSFHVNNRHFKMT
jgi:hypothetical protein